MAKGTKASAKAAKAKEHVRRSERHQQKRRKVSATFPPQPTAEDDVSDDQVEASATDEDLHTHDVRQAPSRISYTSSMKHGGSEQYLADTEDSCDQRRFSDLYGHGHHFAETDNVHQTLFDVNEPVTSKKRSFSDYVETTSPKRVRFDSAANETKEFSKHLPPSPTKARVSDSRASGDIPSQAAHGDLGDGLRENIALPQNPDYQLLTSLREYSQPLSLSQISSMFSIIQKLTHKVSREHFGNVETDAAFSIDQAMSDFPLHDLERNHSALFYTTMNVLDASTTDDGNDGWLKFFASPTHRPFLVYAILGEWFTQRIFKDTAFGLSPDARTRMHEDVDVAYLYYDPFVRAKERSKIIADCVGVSGEEDLAIAAEALADELLIVLAPLLKTVGSSSLHSREHRLRNALVNLIEHCAALNWSIVRSGEHATLVRIADRLENGRQYWRTAPMHCLNQGMVNKTCNNEPSGKNERLVVKMTCWGRVEALIGHGMDQIQMAELELKARQEHDASIELPRDLIDRTGVTKALDRGAKKFSWEQSGLKEEWDVLPRELWSQAFQQQQKIESLKRNARWRRKLERRQNKQQRSGDQGGNSDDSDDGSNRGSGDNSSSDSETSDSSDTTDVEMYDEPTRGKDRKQEPPRGSWVTFYSCLNPHQVYCEWAKPENEYKQALSSKTIGDIDGKSIRELNSLKNTVRAARANLPFVKRWSVAKRDDLVIEIWNRYCQHNIKCEWVGLGLAVSTAAFAMYSAGAMHTVARLTSASFSHAIAGVKGLSTWGAEITTLIAEGFPVAAEALRLIRGSVKRAFSHMNEELTKLLQAVLDAGHNIDGTILHRLRSMLIAIGRMLPKPSAVTQRVTDEVRNLADSEESLLQRGLAWYFGWPDTTTATQFATAVTTATTSIATAATVTAATPTDPGFWHKFFDVSNPHPSQGRDSVMNIPTAVTTSDSMHRNSGKDDGQNVEDRFTEYVNEWAAEHSDDRSSANVAVDDKFTSHVNAWAEKASQAKDDPMSTAAKVASEVDDAMSESPRLSRKH